jgi:hypothetical protein
MLAKPDSKSICGACSVSNDLVETILSREETLQEIFQNASSR